MNLSSLHPEDAMVSGAIRLHLVMAFSGTWMLKNGKLFKVADKQARNGWMMETKER
jgi:hypothetical protein